MRELLDILVYELSLAEGKALDMGAKKDPKATSKTPAKNPKKKEGGGGGKAKKKKWSKGKSRDKLNNLVLFDKNTYDKLYKEVPTYKLITPSIVSERLKVTKQSAVQSHDAILPTLFELPCNKTYHFTDIHCQPI